MRCLRAKRPEAEPLLAAARGVTVLPDVVVNSGTGAWWWTLFGDIGAELVADRPPVMAERFGWYR
ncbi:hypothetical protein ABT373_10535 [Streptomyces sp. NPDC000070]|uniref:hypothetical protein n=1 Tax=Streptomyces sp. NPDC000070 TaxID=3154240 RepID=UPI0033232718